MNQSLESIIESILFISGEGISLSAMTEKLGVEIEEIKQAIERLKAKYSSESGIHLVSYHDKVQFSSNPEYASFVEAVLNPIREKALTRATLETLAIIAYKQPVTRLEIEEIRGVGSDYAVQVLIEHKLIDVVGRKDTPGKPLLFGTTDEFLKRFDMQSLDMLPKQSELMERIKLIKEETSNSLYNEFKIPDDEEEFELPSDDEELKKFEQELEQELGLHEKLEGIYAKEELQEKLQEHLEPENDMLEAN